jgi:hypothetical protein
MTTASRERILVLNAVRLHPDRLVLAAARL